MTVQELIEYCEENKIPFSTRFGNSDHYGDFIESSYLSLSDKGFIDLHIDDRGGEPY